MFCLQRFYYRTDFMVGWLVGWLKRLMAVATVPEHNIHGQIFGSAPKTSSQTLSTSFWLSTKKGTGPKRTSSARVWPIQLEGSVLNTEQTELKENALSVHGEVANHKQVTDSKESKCTSPGQKCVSTPARKGGNGAGPKHKQTLFLGRRPLPFGGSTLEAYSRTSGESNNCHMCKRK